MPSFVYFFLFAVTLLTFAVCGFGYGNTGCGRRRPPLEASWRTWTLAASYSTSEHVNRCGLTTGYGYEEGLRVATFEAPLSCWGAVRPRAGPQARPRARPAAPLAGH